MHHSDRCSGMSSLAIWQLGPPEHSRIVVEASHYLLLKRRP